MSELEINRFNKQYPTISLKFAANIHDRFIIIDYGTSREKFYVCGASSKDVGQKICTITQLYDKGNMHAVVDKLIK